MASFMAFDGIQSCMLRVILSRSLLYVPLIADPESNFMAGIYGLDEGKVNIGRGQKI